MSSDPSDLYRPYSCMDNFNQEMARVICYKTTSALSILAIIYTLSIIHRKWKHRSSSIDPYQRIMVGLSSYSLFFLVSWFMGSWMAPVETGWWGASGNMVTCTIQGCLIWFGIFGNVLYNVLLSGQMLLLVTFGWTERKFEQLIERHAHILIFLFSSTCAITPIFFQGYNGECGRCCIMPMPMWCGDWFWGDGSECVRGSPMLAQVYWGFIFVGFPLVTLFVTAAMFTVYRSVRNQEKRTIRYRVFAENHYRESKRIRKTMLLYTSSFYICWVTTLTLMWAHSTPQPYPLLNVIGEMLLPVQGVFVMCVFIQPRCVKYQKDHPGTHLLMAYLNVLFNINGCCKAVRRFGGRFSAASGTNTEPEVETADDGIGFSTYNEDDSLSLRRIHTTPSRLHSVDEVEDKIEEGDDEEMEATESIGATPRMNDPNNCDTGVKEPQLPCEDGS